MTFIRRVIGATGIGALVVTGSVVGAVPAFAAPVSATTSAGVEYTADDSDVAAGARVTGFDGSTPTVTIPDTVAIGGTDYDVVSIAGNVFQNQSLTSVTIGDNVTTIDGWAFDGNELTALDLGDSVTTIGSNAFKGSDLTNLALPNGLTTIGNGAFSRNSLTQLTIPDSVTVIENWAFADNSLSDLTLGASLEKIGWNAFLRNDLTDVSVPDTVTDIGRNAFDSNDLNTVTLGASVEWIGSGAFADNNLTSITIPDAVTSIDAQAFQDNQLTSVTLGSSLESISSFVFAGNDLTTVTIPASVTSLGVLAFGLNDRLTSVSFEGPAPTIEEASASTGTFDTASGSLVLSYPEAYAQSSTYPDGYTTPTWQGYDARPVEGDPADPGYSTVTITKIVLDEGGNDVSNESNGSEAAGWSFRASTDTPVLLTRAGQMDSGELGTTRTTTVNHRVTFELFAETEPSGVQTVDFEEGARDGYEYDGIVCNDIEYDTVADDGADFTLYVPWSSDVECTVTNIRLEDEAPDPVFDDLEVTKTAQMNYDVNYDWDLTKVVDGDTEITVPTGQDAEEVTYNVTITPHGPQYSNFSVTGQIRIVNPNDVDMQGINVDDTMLGIDCVINGGDDSDLSVAGNGGDPLVLDYVCGPFGTDVSVDDDLTNEAVVTWDAQAYTGTSGTASASATAVAAEATVTSTHATVLLTDSQRAGWTQQFDASAGAQTVSYELTWAVDDLAPGECVDRDNTATVSDDAGLDVSASAAVTLCAEELPSDGPADDADNDAPGDGHDGAGEGSPSEEGTSDSALPVTGQDTPAGVLALAGFLVLIGAALVLWRRRVS